MNLDELVKAAIAKALADYISTLSDFDEGFMGKLADMVSQRVWQREEKYRQVLQREYMEKLRDMEQKMRSEQMDRMARAPTWKDHIHVPDAIKKKYYGP